MRKVSSYHDTTSYVSRAKIYLLASKLYKSFTALVFSFFFFLPPDAVKKIYYYCYYYRHHHYARVYIFFISKHDSLRSKKTHLYRQNPPCTQAGLWRLNGNERNERFPERSKSESFSRRIQLRSQIVRQMLVICKRDVGLNGIELLL